MNFKEQIQKELTGLSTKQQRAFAWRCAVRALPFLGYKGHFDFWKEKDTQKHLYSIFYALDTISAATTRTHTTTTAAVVANAAASAAAAAGTTFIFDVAATATYAARVAAANTATSVAAYAFDTAYHASHAPKAPKAMDLKKIIQQDLKDIKSNKGPQISIASYGEAWGNFQRALKSVGCEYWGVWYQDLFENNFEFDREELKRRINVPEEIKEQGAAVVANYMEELGLGAKRLNESRIIILGDKGVGKTCVARRLVDPDAEMTTPEESTAGVDTSLWELAGDDINVRVWDFAGHTVTHAVHQFFLSERCLYIMVYDGRTDKRDRLEYWLEHMKNYGGDSKAIILVNERDQHSVNIPKNYLMEQYPIAGFYSLNVKKDKEKLEGFRKEVAAYIKNNPSWKNQEIPTSYYKVKEELEKRFNQKGGKKGQEHIGKNTFLGIAKKHKVEDPEKLLRDLHFLGVSLWYKEMEEYDTLILNPEWISQGVYKVINWVNEEKGHSLTLDCFLKVFKKDMGRFPEDKHKFLFNLIKHYELAFETDNGNRLIIPHLLKEDQPAELPVFGPGESLLMRYEADQPLPPNTISRFIIRHNGQIRKDNKQFSFWKYGAILEDGKGSVALVREKDRTIHVSVKGGDKTNYISELRGTLNVIFESYKSKRPKLTYKVTGDHIDNRQELWLSEKKIATLFRRNRPYYDEVSDTDIPMQPTVINFNITIKHVHIIDTENVKKKPTGKNWRTELKKLMAKDMGQAIGELEMRISEDSNKFEDLMIASGRFNRIDKKMKNDTIGHDVASTELNKIQTSLSSLIDELMEVDLN